MNHRFTFYFTLLCLYLPSVCIAQAQRDGLSPSLGSTRQDSIPEGITPLDTLVPMSYVLIQDPDINYYISDTFQWEDTKDYPLRWDESHLGNYGSASRALAPSVSKQIGFSTGWFQYDPYYVHEESFKYYNQDVPVSKIKYGQGGQEDTHLSLDFGRSFAKGFNLSVAYRRINQVGEFAHQRQKDTGFSVGIWHDAPSGKYDAFYNYISNAVVAEENGGISEPDLIGSPNYPDATIPTYIRSGITTHKHRSFLTKQIIHLTADSSQLGIDLWLKEQFSTGLFKYVDEDATASSGYYGPEYLVDERGIRQYTFERENQLSLGISLPWRGAHSTLHSSLRYRSIALEQEPMERMINELYVDLAGEFQWIEPLKLKGQLSLGLGQAEGALSFRAEADLNTGVLGHLIGYWSIMTRNPFMVESSLYVNQQLVYQKTLRNPFMNEVGVTWDLRKQNLQAGVKWFVYDNFIYFDTVSFPNQVEGSFSLQRFFIAKDFDFNWIGVKGSLFWQPDPHKELAIPELGFAASLYGRMKILDKKVELIPGVDVTYQNDYAGVSYFPVNGRYHLTDGPSIPDYLRVDVGLGLQIKFLRVFARIEDFVGMFEKRELYQADFYPHYSGYFRLGLEASFFN